MKMSHQEGFSPVWLSSSLQYWHKGCFSCEVCKMALSMTTYKGFEKKPYCSMWVFTHGSSAGLKQSRLIPTLTEQAGRPSGSKYLCIYDLSPVSATSLLPASCLSEGYWKHRNVLPLHFHPSGKSFKSHANIIQTCKRYVSDDMQKSLWTTDSGFSIWGWKLLLFIA